MYQWVVLVHVLASFAFFMAHGASAVMAFRLRQERDLNRIQALLDLSNATLPVMYISLLLLLLAGIIAGIMGNWFRQGWIWTALVILIVLAGGMMGYARRFYVPIRKAVGLPYREGRDEKPAEPPLSEGEIAVLIQATNPGMMLGASFVLIAIIVGLMMFKPF